MSTTPATPRTPLSPTPRTRLTRARQRAGTDRADLHALLGSALVGHLGLVRDGAPVVLPVAVALDVDGPDDAGTLYLHGSSGAGWLRAVDAGPVCVTVTEVDALVLARSGMHHSMNYRSAVVHGTARVVTDAAERERALGLVVDQVVPGRSATLRPSTRRELAATALVAVPLAEASLKARTGGVDDDEADVDPDVWAGVVPLGRTAGDPVTAPDSRAPVPDDVRRRVADLRGGGAPDGTRVRA